MLRERRNGWIGKRTVGTLRGANWRFFKRIYDCFRTGDNADTDIIDAATNAMSNAQKMKIMKKKLKNWRTRGVCTTTAVCLICHSKYGYVWHFERHIKIHGEWECRLSRHVQRSRWKNRKWKSIHSHRIGSGGQLATKCSQCPQYFSSNVDLDRHMAKVHRHPCHLCDRTYLAKTGLEIHLASAHERYKCDKCGKWCDLHKILWSPNSPSPSMRRSNVQSADEFEKTYSHRLWHTSGA